MNSLLSLDGASALGSYAPPAPGLDKSRTVLIVDDDPTLQRAMSARALRLGLRVQSALHYDAAVGRLRSSTPDVVCVDVNLPTLSGFDLCEYIRGPLGLTDLPILIMSDDGSPEGLAYAEEAGASCFMLKPFSMSDFATNVSALLAGVSVRDADDVAPCRK